MSVLYIPQTHINHERVPFYLLSSAISIIVITNHDAHLCVNIQDTVRHIQIPNVSIVHINLLILKWIAVNYVTVTIIGSRL